MQCFINSCFIKLIWGEVLSVKFSAVLYRDTYRGLCIVIRIVSWLCWWYTALIIITWRSWLVIFVSAANELAAQHSNAWLVLAVAVAAHFRNPPPSPAPPVYICYEVIHVCYTGVISYVIRVAAVFLTCSQQHVVDVLAVASRYLLCRCVADLFHQVQTHYHWSCT